MLPVSERREIAWPGAAASPHMPAGWAETEYCPAAYARTRWVGEVWRYYRAMRKGVLSTWLREDPPAILLDALSLLDAEIDSREAERVRRMRQESKAHGTR